MGRSAACSSGMLYCYPAPNYEAGPSGAEPAVSAENGWDVGCSDEAVDETVPGGEAGALTYTAQPLPGASSSLAALDTPPTPGVQVHGRDLNRPQRRGEA